MERDGEGGERAGLTAETAHFRRAFPHLAGVSAVGLGVAVAQRRAAPRLGAQTLARFGLSSAG